MAVASTIADDSPVDDAQQAPHARPRVAVITNSVTPYRQYVHQRLVDEVPQVELWTLTTHDNAYQRWQGMELPESIRPVAFGAGEPTNEQAQLRYSRREWNKGGRIIAWLKQHDVAAVICQGCGDFGRLRILRWCHRNGIPCYLSGDFNVQGDKLKGALRRLKQFTYRHAINCSAGLMPCGRNGRELLFRYGGQQKPVFWFPFVPNVELLQQMPADLIERVRRTYPALASSRRRMIFSARMMPAKRPDLAIEAFSAVADELPNWDLVMVGDGALREQLEASVPQACRDRIHFTGFVNNPADMAGIYGCGDILLLPSDHEPWGVVMVEAAAAGLAIVCSDAVGAAPELVVEGENGANFAAGDLQSCIAAIRRVAAEQQIDSARSASAGVFTQWLQECSPIDGFRQAMQHCGVLPQPSIERTTSSGETNPSSNSHPKEIHSAVPLSGGV
ncbi:glycosyltransferase family 4 protein [Aeoliella sp. ICT_H6.2]|uniref:Glycosyltransferase family 4 protein n=1 Tax=Aeoliella straminimaris TaxID=2954799 RepID=A0A9X2JKW0_9BACT|nr:glycosyltransferase family 4 protein [Aeoliella straminimaris]MCO6047519.1 glycosyltransferase family 4 protein [Aeoliella straminimaris]